jgi:hypothetical protein
VLAAFYTGDYTGSNRSIVSYMPDEVLTTVNLTVYDLGSGPPRDPDFTHTWNWQPDGSALTPMPREVALVLSYYAGRLELEPPIVAARRRGRLYLGPFTSEALSGDGTVVPNLQGVMQGAADNVLNTTEDVAWMQLSSTNAAFSVVTGGFIDNAWDTQRSRGREPSSRVTWGDPFNT